MKGGYLFLGGDTAVPVREIVGIFDLDRCTISGSTRDFLKRAEQEGGIETITYELPKSFIVCTDKENEEKVYLSQIAPATLLKRHHKKSE